MHIPEGYLSPSTCLTLMGAMLPVWYRATAVVKFSIDAARVPVLAMVWRYPFLP